MSAPIPERPGGDRQVSRLRLSLVAVVSVALFASLFARVYDLQVVGAGSYRVQAEANRVRTVSIPAPRGRILDRNGKVLVDNRVGVVVAIDRTSLGELSQAKQDDLITRLSLDLTAAGRPMSPDEIRAKLASVQYSRYTPVPLVTDLPEDFKIYLDERAADYPSVVVERIALRSYPYATLASNVLGYVGKINGAELEAKAYQTAKPYALNDEIGKAGVEQEYEDYLRGTPGERRIEVDVRGNPVRVISERPPKAGDDLVLSLDVDIQALAQQKVEQGLADARARVNRDGSRNAAPVGAAVVLDPNNGQVLAMASYPTYDPRPLVDGMDNAEQAWLQDPANHFPLNNWAIQGQWAPGSTFKLFVGYGALMAGVMTPDTVYADRGGYTLAGCTGPHCSWSNAGGNAYGNVRIDRALTVSSDAYFYNVGAQFWLHADRFGGEEGLQQYLRPWGLGAATGSGLIGEKAGVVPTPAWKLDYGSRHEGFDSKWRPGDNINMAVGQGDVLVTPLQLANAYATFANGGTRYAPQVVLRAQKYATDQVTKQFDPIVAGQVDLPPEVREPLLRGLEGVPRNGTAAGAFSGFPLNDFPVAGKTGTAQVLNKSDTAVFSSFGPVPAPRYQVTVFMDQSGFGATAAAPVARALFDAFAGVKPLLPAGPDGLPQGTADGLTGDNGGGYD
jgi:penicillin-binding protein 2